MYNEGFIQLQFKHKQNTSKGQGSCAAEVSPGCELRNLINSQVWPISLAGVITDISHTRSWFSWLRFFYPQSSRCHAESFYHVIIFLKRENQKKKVR